MVANSTMSWKWRLKEGSPDSDPLIQIYLKLMRAMASRSGKICLFIEARMDRIDSFDCQTRICSPTLI
jgi:hypothetical protein